MWLPIAILLLAVSPTYEASTSSLYSALGVSNDGTQQQIKSAYRKLALKNHPDKVPPSERAAAEKKFKRIGRAYEILKDEKKRHDYDRFGEAGINGGGAGGNPFAGASPGGNPFAQQFGGGMGNPFGGGNPFAQHFGGGGGFYQQQEINLGDILREMMGGGRNRGSQRYHSQRSSQRGWGAPPSPPPNSQQRPNQQVISATAEISASDIRNERTKRFKVSTLSGASSIYIINLKSTYRDGTKFKFKPRLSYDGQQRIPSVHITIILSGNEQY